MKAFCQGVHGNPPAKRAEDDLLGCRIKRPRLGGKQSLPGVLAVEILDGVANGFGGAAEAMGNAAAHFGQGAAGDARQTAGAAQNVLFFHLAQLRKPPAPLHPHLVRAQKRVHQRWQEAHLPAALEQYGQADQATFAPAVDGLGCHVELAAKFFEGHHRLGHGFHGLRGHRGGELGNHGTKVAPQIFAADHQVRISVGTKIGDTVTNKLVRILPLRIDLGQQPLGTGQLLQAPRRRSEANLLVRQFLQCQMFEDTHSLTPFSSPGITSVTPLRLCCYFRAINPSLKPTC